MTWQIRNEQNLLLKKLCMAGLEPVGFPYTASLADWVIMAIYGK